jgi:hypothetical protein
MQLSAHSLSKGVLQLSQLLATMDVEAAVQQHSAGIFELNQAWLVHK